MITNENLDNYFIIDFKQEDINNDNIPDNIYLVGIKPFGEGSLLIKSIRIIIIDGRDGSRHEIIPKYNAGYAPSMLIGDLTKTNTKEIMISIFSGSTGGESYYYIYSFSNNVKKVLFDFEKFNALQPYQVMFRDNYKVTIFNEESYTIDLTHKSPEYKDYIYNNDGSLKRPTRGRLSPIIKLEPIPNTSEIEVTQKLIGYYSADILGELKTRLRFNGDEFVKFDDSIILYR